MRQECDIEEFQPSFDEVHANLTTAQHVLLYLAVVFVLLICGLAAFHLYYIWTYVSLERAKNKLSIMCFVHPMLAILSLLMMISPRTYAIFTSLGVLYLMWALYNLVTLARVLYYGRQNFSEALIDENQRLGTKVPPLCCCFPCMPQILPTEANLDRFEKFVLQAILVRTVVGFINIFLLAEFGQQATKYIQKADLCALPFILFGVFGAQALIRLQTGFLTGYRLMQMFYIIIMPLPLFSLQYPLIFYQILMRFNVFPCGPYMTPAMNAHYVYSFVMIVELFIIAVVGTVIFMPKKTRMFDKYDPVKLIENVNQRTSTDCEGSCTKKLTTNL